MPEKWNGLSEKQWRELRKKHITSTEIAALFNQSPYLTKYQLYHEKRHPELIVFESTERMRWGKRLEPVIAQGIAQDHGVIARKGPDFAIHSKCKRAGTSMDYIIVDLMKRAPYGYGELADWFKEHGQGLLEIKNVDSLIHRFGDWEEEECPVHIEAQLQYQLEIYDLPWGAVGAFVGGNTPVLYIRERDREVGKQMIAMVEDFWSDIERGIEPDADYLKDAAFIDRLYGYSEPGKVVDLTDHNRVPVLVGEYKRGHELVKMGDDTKKAAKAELKTLVGEAERVTVGPHTITMNMRAPTEVAAHVKKGYRDFRITTKKETPK